KFLDDQWMRENGFVEQGWETTTVGDVLRRLGNRKVHVTASSETVADAVMQMKEHGISQLPVVDDGAVVGIVTEADLLSKLVEDRASLASSVAEVMFRKVRTVRADDDAGALTKLFAEGLIGLVVDGSGKLLGVVTKMDLVDFLTKPVKK
ncbi:MAG: CBS domain-containing protein, partial [Planctomycetes bacterium]|nr:CBS domain-containing protein [Planctomycetota bacterium]